MKHSLLSERLNRSHSRWVHYINGLVWVGLLLLIHSPAAQAQDCTAPLITISASPSLTIATGTTARLTASGASSYTWSTGATSTTVTTTTAVSVYSVTGVTGGCSATASVQVVQIASCAPEIVYPCSYTYTGQGYPDYTFFRSDGTYSTTFTVGEPIFSFGFDPSHTCRTPSTLKPVFANLPTGAQVLCPNIFMATYFSQGLSKTCPKIGPAQYLISTYQKFSFTTPGVYPVTFTDGTTVNITVDPDSPIPPPTNSVTLSASLESSKPVAFTATASRQELLETQVLGVTGPGVPPSGYIYSYFQWTGNGLTEAKIQAPENTYTLNNPSWGVTYQVELLPALVYCGNKSRIISNSITIPNPTASVSASTVCAGGSVSLSSTAVGVGPFSYTWVAPEGITLSDPGSPSPTATIAPTVTGEQTFTLYIQDISSLTAQSATVTTSVTVINPSVNVTTLPSATITSGGSVTLTASGADSYTWSNGSSDNPITLNNLTSATTLSVTGITGGCSAIASAVVSVTAVPCAVTATISGNPIFCAGSSATLTASGAGDGGSYLWSTGETNPTVAINTSTQVSVTVTTASGCTATTSIQTGVGAPPSLTISANPSLTIATGMTTRLTATGATSLTWSTGARSTTISAGSAGTYSVTGISGGCLSSASVQVVQVAPCPEEPMNALGIPPGNGYPNYLFFRIDGTHSYTFAPGETIYNYASDIANPNTCRPPTSINPNYATLPTIARIICPYTLVRNYVTASLDGDGNLTYLTKTCLAVGPTRYVFAAQAKFAIDTPGDYPITFADGTTRILTISASATPAIDPGWSLTMLAAPQPDGTLSLTAVPVNLIQGSQNIASYTWQRGTNVLASFATSNTYTVTNPLWGQPYRVTGFVRNFVGGPFSATLTSNDYTVPFPAPQVGSTTVCAGSELGLSAVVLGAAPFSYSWTAPQGITLSDPASSTPTATIGATVSGEQTFTLTFMDSTTPTAQVSTQTVSVTVNPAPSLLITGSPSLSITTGGSVTLTASGANSYRWSNGSTINPLVLTNLTSATTLSVTGTSGTCSGTASATIGVTATPCAISASISGNLTVCAGNPTTLTAAGGNQFRWSSGVTTAINSITPVKTGVYSVTITDTATGCTATTGVTVELVSFPGTPTLAASGTVSCSFPTITLTTTPAAQANYQFIGPGLTQNGLSHTATVSAGGTYSVIVTTINGCTALATTTVQSATNAVNATLAASGTISCASPSVTLTAAPAGAAYQFSGPGLSLNGQSQTAVVTQAGMYSVIVTGAGGCTALATTTVTGSTIAPQLSISASPSATPTQGQAVTLTASGADSGATLTFAWSTGANTASINPPTSATGTTVYSVTAVGPNACSATAQITVTVGNPALFCGPDPATIGRPLTLLEPIYDCATGRVQFRVSGGNGTPITYAAVGITGPTTTCSAFVDTQLAQDIRAGQSNVEPFLITATQNGVTVSLRWDARATCAGGTANTPPALANVVGPQSATLGTPFSLDLSRVFTDAQTPDALVLAATGLPAGLQLTARTLSGTPSTTGISTVTLTATDPGGLTNTMSFTLTVGPAASLTVTPPPTGTALAATLVSYGCTSGAITFGFTGGTSAPVEYLAIGVTGWTTNPTHVLEAGLRVDPKPITIRVRQNGVEGTPFVFDFAAYCAGTLQPPTNTPPSVANAVGPQSATVGLAYSLDLGAIFTDTQTPGGLTLSATGLPAGLSLSGNRISGTPSTSGVSTVTLTATDPGSLSVSTTFVITVHPNSSTGVTPPTPPVVGGPLAATVVSYNCQTGAITFGATGGNRAAVEYLAIGITGWTTNTNHIIEAGLRADPKPVTIQIRQNGVGGTPFTFDFTAFCAGNPQPPTNTPPTVVNVVGPQSATVGVNYTLNLSTVFFDAQTPAGSLVLGANGLPAGLSLSGSSISGTPSTSGVSSVTLTATDAGGLSINTGFVLTVSPGGNTTPTPPVGGPLAATVVSYNCQTGAITFGATGGNGAAVEFFAIGITGWTTNVNGTIEAGLRADAKPVTIRVRQNGVEGIPFVFDFGAFCSRPARIAQPNEAPLTLTVWGNPTSLDVVDVEIGGAYGQSLMVQVMGSSGQILHTETHPVAPANLRQRVPLRAGPGVYLIRVSTTKGSVTQKIVRY